MTSGIRTIRTRLTQAGIDPVNHEPGSAAPTRRYVLHEKFLSIGDDFAIRDADGNERFFVDGRQALDMLGREEFSLVLLDIMLPEMNGYQVLETLKADRSLSHIPVIITTALDESDGKARCIELGAEDYLTKPFNPVMLKSRISDCLHRHNQAQTGQ